MALLHLALVLACLIKISFACNGINITKTEIKTCDGATLIQMKNFDVIMDENCNIVPTGCFVITQPIESGNLTYSLEKKGVPPLRFKGKKDICPTLESSKESPEVTAAMKLVKLPNRCPIPKGELCATGKMSMEKYKSQIKAGAGEYNGKFLAYTNNGEVCFTIYVKVENKNGMNSGMPNFG